MIIKYENSNGLAFTLCGDGLTYVDPMELHTFEWDYALSNRITGMGGDASDFARYPRTFELELRMRGMNRAEFIDQVNRLHDVTEADMINGSPGRLSIPDVLSGCCRRQAGTSEKQQLHDQERDCAGGRTVLVYACPSDNQSVNRSAEQ